jgi:CheY-like chemotaxis protein
MKRLLVVDDDAVFRAVTLQIAKQKNIDVTVCGSLQELSMMVERDHFDVVVMDYYLDNLRNFLSGAEVASVFGATPVLLISNTSQCMESGPEWPTAIRKFMHKREGAQQILEAALRL